MKFGKKSVRGWNYRLTAAFTAVFMVMAVLGFYLTQIVLLENAQNMGNELAVRYAEMELFQVRSAELLLKAGIEMAEDQAALGVSPEERKLWAEDFLKAVAGAAEDKIIPYAVIDGSLMTAGSWGHWEEDPDLTAQAWYQRALQGNGAVVSYVEPDPDTESASVFLVQKCESNQDAIGLCLKDWQSGTIMDTLPAGSSYYLCNSNGELLYAKTQLQVEPEVLQEYIRTIFYQIQAGQLDDAQEYIYDLVAEKRAVYFHTSEDGGASIITIPYSALLGDLRHAFYLVMGICCVIVLFLIFLSVREYRMQKRLSRVNETASALGNLYYSIYRVNWVQGTYEAVKSAEDIAQRIPARGRYDQLLNEIGQVIDQDTFHQFKTSFSLENVHKLVEQNVSDFGGDFRRLFGEEYRWVNVRLLFDPLLHHNEAILCFRQVDQEKRQQLQQLQMLENALDQARESELAKEKFFSQMSHDMRTPLSTIMTTVELAQRRGECVGQAAESLKKIQVSAGHLLELINDILEMSRMEETELSLKTEPCDLQETVLQCLSTFQAQADLQHKNLETNFTLENRRVYTDAFRLQQVLNNLISNALKFTGEGDHIQVEVSQFSRQGRGMCRIIVRDTGIGMSKEFLPQLFTPYARESRFGTQTVLGTGLGMTIVKTIISRMQGEIQVESAPEQGTTFTLTIPMESVPQELPEVGNEPAQDPEEVLKGKRILLAEDFEMNLEIATELLKLCGAQVTQTRNGSEAVEAFRVSAPGWYDVILMDMNMPVMDGCEAASMIRGLDREDAATTPILALTANAFAEDVAASARAGMNAHIAKPLDLHQLAAVLGKLERKR